MAELKNLVVEGATIMYRNFTGKEGQYNRAGDRNFCLLLDDDLAAVMENDGWNVKSRKPTPDGDPGQKYIQVGLKYWDRHGNKIRAPKVVMITSKGKTDLDEEVVDLLDQADIGNVDLVVRPYEWAMGGNTGVKAYLEALYVTIREDALAYKYRDVPEIGSSEGQAALTASANGEDVWEGEVVYDSDVDGDRQAIEA